MKTTKNSMYALLAGGLLLTAFTFNACKKKTTDPTLPTIGGYNNSNEVAAANLKAHWGFEGNGNEDISKTAPTTTANATFAAGGVIGQAVTLDNGYLYYANPLGALTTGGSWTLSAWIQVANNQETTNTPSLYFQSAVPGKLFGNINGMIETGHYKSISDTLDVKAIYQDLNGGTQDNINNYGVLGTDYQVVKGGGTNKWIHLITTYDGSNVAHNIFQLYANGVKVGNKQFEDKTVNSFKYSANEVIIGGWYNNVPNKAVSVDPWTLPFKGKIDEIRVYNKLLSAAEIKALYDLGVAGR